MKTLKWTKAEIILAVPGVIVLAVLGINILRIVAAGPQSLPRVKSTKNEPALHRVTYKVEVSEDENAPGATADLTYRNATGGTDQIVARLPWVLTMENQKPGSRFSLLATKKPYYVKLHAVIYVDGEILQEAIAVGEHGTAMASGHIPWF